MKLNNSLIFAAAFAVAIAGYAKPDEKSSISAKDKAFVTEAEEGNLAEVQMGELGNNQGTKQGVKDLSAMLVKDHSAANDELRKLAEAKGIKLPSSPSAKQQMTLKSLGKKSGDEFDKAFAQEAVEDHKKDIAKYEKAARELDDADLKAFAAGKIDTLKMHLKMAQDAQAPTVKPSTASTPQPGDPSSPVMTRPDAPNAPSSSGTAQQQNAP